MKHITVIGTTVSLKPGVLLQHVNC